jgi:hypothetical protein
MAVDGGQTDGQPIDLAHLRPSVQSFFWREKSGFAGRFCGTIRYSTHCYTEKHMGPVLPGDAVIWDHNRNPRRFDPLRYAQSQALPALIGRLFTRPSTQIQTTTRANYFVCQALHLDQGQGRYYAFFLPRYRGLGDGGHMFDLFVQSAYGRETPPETPHHRQRLMFGHVMARLVQKAQLAASGAG